MIKTIILAAGQGTRLRPYTNDKPKCLVSLLGTSILERQIATLKQCGINDIHIAAGYRADQIEALGHPVTVNERFSQTNMVETLFSARKFLEKEGDLLISYGDIVYEQENLEKVLSSNEEITLMIDKQWRRYWALRLENPLDDAETLILDDQGYVQELGKKPENYTDIQGQYTGLIKIRADKIQDLIRFYDGLDRKTYYDGKDFDNMYMTSFLQLLINVGWKTKAAIVENGWLEVDSVDDLKLYERLASEEQLSKFCQLD